MNPCIRCKQAGDKNHNCGMPKSFRLKCGAVEEAPQNLPKADVYSLLADVRADVERILLSEIEISNNGDKSTDRIVALSGVIEKIDKVSKHFS